MTNFQTAIRLTPTPIKRWLGSELVMDAIEALNRKLGIGGEDERVIPFLIMRLETKDLAPENFVSELSSYLGTDAQTAKDVAEEIKTKILKHIQKDLYDWGIDIDVIKPERLGAELKYKPEKHTVYETEQKKVTVPEPIEVKPPEPSPFVINLDEKLKAQPLSVEPQGIEPKLATPTESQPRGATGPKLTTPFILREEKSPSPIAESEKPKISISSGLAQKKTETTPFRVELAEEEEKKKRSLFSKTEQPKDRVVHYVGPKTSLFPGALPFQKGINQKQEDGTPVVPSQKPTHAPPAPEPPAAEEVIDLSLFRKVQKTKPTAESGPNIKGNTVDLR